MSETLEAYIWSTAHGPRPVHIATQMRDGSFVTRCHRTLVSAHVIDGAMADPPGLELYHCKKCADAAGRAAFNEQLRERERQREQERERQREVSREREHRRIVARKALEAEIVAAIGAVPGRFRLDVERDGFKFNITVTSDMGY